MESRKKARVGRAHNRELAGAADFHDINWHHYSHPQLFNMISAANPAHIRGQAGQWGVLGKKIEETTGAVQATLNQLFGTWQGAAADGSRASNDKLSRWATDMSQRTHQIGDGLTRYSEAVAEAKAKMPPPQFAVAEANALRGDSITLSDGASGPLEILALTDDQKPNFEKHHAAWLEATRVMHAYGQQSQAVHDSLPPPYEPAPGTGSGTGPSSTDFPSFDDGSQGGHGKPVEPIGSTNPGPGRSGVAGDLNGDGIPDGTTPGGYTGAGTGAGPGTGTGYGAGLAAGPGSGNGADAAARGAGGLSGAGGLAARGAGAAGLAGVRGGAGAGGFGAPLGAGAGAGREEDGEHKNKFVEGLDLFDDLPPAYPPVFGA